MDNGIEIVGFRRKVFLQFYLFRMMWENGKARTLQYVLLCLGTEGLPLVEVIIWKYIVDELIDIYQTGRLNYSLCLCIVGYVFFRAVPVALRELRDATYEEIKRKLAFVIDKELFSKMPNLGLGFFDNPDNRDMVEEIQVSEGTIAGASPWVVGSIVNLFTIVMALIMFFSYGVIVGIIYICTYIPGAVIAYRNKVVLDKYSIESIPETRRKNYYKALLTTGWAAKELRLYNAIGFFKSLYYSTRDMIRKKRRKVFFRGIIIGALASICAYAGIIAICGFSIFQVIHGRLSVGTMVLYIGLTQTIGSQITGTIENMSLQIAFALPAANRYYNFLKMDAVFSEGNQEIDLNNLEIVFDRVSFHYPGNTELILDDFSMKLKKGEIVALVGENGAGKSTIVKLLLRLYEPTGGSIKINGIPYEEYPLDKLHALFGVCFQDVTHYSMTLGENIGIADCNKNIEKEHIETVIKQVGLENSLRDFPKGIHTQMTKKFDEKGIELSGGQWQRIGIARSLYRNAEVVVLDEPAASLDVESENRILSTYREICNDKIGLLISHRLSNMKIADRIVLIEKGKVIEEGTHNELMQQKGKYCELFTIQAEKFNKGME